RPGPAFEETAAGRRVHGDSRASGWRAEPFVARRRRRFSVGSSPNGDTLAMSAALYWLWPVGHNQFRQLIQVRRAPRWNRRPTIALQAALWRGGARGRI